MSKPRDFPIPLLFHPKQGAMPPGLVIREHSSLTLAQYPALVTVPVNLSRPTLR